MNSLDHLRPLRLAANSIATAAGWSPQDPTPDNKVMFRLENGLRLEIACPDGRTLILRSSICILPEPNEGAEDEAEAIIEQVLQLNAAVCRKSRSIPALHERHLELYRIIVAGETASNNPDMPAEARTFLNDLAWWRKQVRREDTTTLSSPPSQKFFTMGDPC